MRSAAPDIPLAGSKEPSVRHSESVPRGTSAMGDVATVLARAPGAAPLGRGRHHTTSPAVQSWSSKSGL